MKSSTVFLCLLVYWNFLYISIGVGGLDLQTTRSYNGSHNNLNNIQLGSAGSIYGRVDFPSSFDDGYGAEISGINRPNVRLLSNELFAGDYKLNDKPITQFHTYIGQLLTVDLCSELINYNPFTAEIIPIIIPTGDRFKDPNGVGNLTMDFNRGTAAPGTGVPGIPRENVNQATHWIDASFLYGTSEEAAAELRIGSGGLLNPDLYYQPPFAPTDGKSFQKSGDSRTNKTPMLFALTNLFFREHNRQCGLAQERHPEWDDEEIFQEARKWVIAIWQRIVVQEYLAALTGRPLDPYTGYDDSIDASIDNFFAACAFRYGHAEVRSTLLRLSKIGEESSKGDTLVRDQYYRPEFWEDQIDYIIGAANSLQGGIALGMVDDVRNFVFTSVGVDLAAINILRGRDHGLPTYNDALRHALTQMTYETPVAAHSSFDTISSDPTTNQRLSDLYGDVEDIDAYVGALAEDHYLGTNVGPLIWYSFRSQLRRLRDGDRFWWENNHFTDEEVGQINDLTIAALLKENYNLTLQDNVFYMDERQLNNFVGTDSFFPYANEYENVLDLSPSYRLSWTHRSTEIDFMIQTRAEGWLGIGFEPNPGTMKGADIVICRIGPNGPEIVDSYAYDVGPPTPDAEDNLLDTSLEQVDGISTCRFTRSVQGSDYYEDHTIKPIGQATIFAFNPLTNDLVYHGPTRSVQSIDYSPDAAVDGDDSNLAAILLGVLLPLLCLLCILLIIIIIVAVVLLKLRAHKEEEENYADVWQDHEELKILGRSAVGSLADLSENFSVDVKPISLRFGLRTKDKFPVFKELTDTITMTNNSGSSKNFCFFVPQDETKFDMQITPGSGVIKSHGVAEVTIKFTLKMTTEVKRLIKLEIGANGYVIELSVIGDISTFLDPEEIHAPPPCIGSGSFGEVYKGTYRKQTVAVKILKNQMSPYNVDQFKDEVALMDRLRSPFVVNFIGASLVPGKYCIVTEFCSGGSMEDLIFSEIELPYHKMMKLSLDMANGIGFLHSNSVIHRDVKPDNFLVISLSSQAPVSVKILDFGTARSITSAQESFSHTAGLGTPIFMAPEILDRKNYSLKVDVYSFALCLWMLATRDEPYKEFERQWDIPRFVCSGKRLPLPTAVEDSFSELIEHCWDHNPATRYTMDEVLSILVKMKKKAYAERGSRKQRSGLKRRDKGRGVGFSTVDPSQFDQVRRDEKSRRHQAQWESERRRTKRKNSKSVSNPSAINDENRKDKEKKGSSDEDTASTQDEAADKNSRTKRRRRRSHKKKGSCNSKLGSSFRKKRKQARRQNRSSD